MDRLISEMKKEERSKAIEYLKSYRTLDENLHNMAPLNSVSYYATDICLKYWDMAIKALEQEPKYCDRNICLKNEYNGIGCDECEVTKSQEPCEDAISRAYIEPIIEELENICINGDEYILNLLADIKNAPPVTQKSGKWIPVSELPKDKMTCLVYGKMHFIPDHVNEKDWYYDYTIGYYKPKYGWSIRGNMSDSDVIAYMPLPPCYDSQESEEISDRNLKMWHDIYEEEKRREGSNKK